MNKTSVYFKNLDGIRFFCFLSVFLFHSFAIEYSYIQEDPFYFFVKRAFAYGNLGVNFFFVLSGFLITYLLIAEKTAYKKINVGHFYIRRILRIWPLYFFCVAFGFLIFPLLKQSFGQVPNEQAHPFMYLTFLANFDYLKVSPDSSVLSVLWSVAIEEQFYLFWPLALALLPTRFYKYLFLTIVIVSLVYRFYNVKNITNLNIHTLSIMGDFAVGATGAYLAHFNKTFLKKLENLPRYALVAIYLVAAAIFFFKNEIFYTNSVLIILERLIISTVFCLVILEQCYSKNSLFKFSSSKFLTKWGNYTYGLYCLHFISILIVHTLIMKFGLVYNAVQFILMEGILSLGLVMVMAYISYHFYERPFLMLKNRFTHIKKQE